jgi:hypothetical protein
VSAKRRDWRPPSPPPPAPESASEKPLMTSKHVGAHSASSLDPRLVIKSADVRRTVSEESELLVDGKKISPLVVIRFAFVVKDNVISGFH